MWVLEMWVIGLLCAFLSRRNEVQSADRLDARTLGLISRGLSVQFDPAGWGNAPARQHVRQVGQYVRALIMTRECGMRIVSNFLHHIYATLSSNDCTSENRRLLCTVL